MNDKNTQIWLLGTVIAVLLAIIATVLLVRQPAPNQNSGLSVDGNLGIGVKRAEDYIPVVKFNEGYYSELPIQTTGNLIVGGTFTQTGAVTLSSTLTVTGTTTANGEVIINSALTHSSVNSTSTEATTYTLVEADIWQYESVLITPNTGSLTLTFPATNTITNMVPNAGDWVDQCWYNATSTSGITITFAAGAGIDLERVATSTTSGSAGVLAIPAQGSACLRYLRETDTDISVLQTPYIDQD